MNFYSPSSFDFVAVAEGCNADTECGATAIRLPFHSTV